MITPLKNTTADGKLMNRRTAITLQISEVIDKGIDAFVEQATSNNNSSLTDLRSETLLFFLRDSKHRNNQDLFNILYAILSNRVGAIALKGFSGNREHQRDLVLDKFNHLIAVDRDDYAPQLDYMECSFDHVVANWRKDVSRSIRRKNQREESLPDENDSDEANHDTIKTIGEQNHGEMGIEDLETYRLQILPAINTLPEREKQVIIMTQKGYNDGSNDPKEVTIASVLGCDRKTVYNLRKRAHQRIREKLGVELS